MAYRIKSKADVTTYHSGTPELNVKMSRFVNDLPETEWASVRADLGLEETGLDRVLAVEWPDRWTARPPSAIQVSIEDLGGHERKINIRR